MKLNEIKEWADERQLYNTPHDTNAFVRMVIEEVGEYLEAKSDEDRVDALCDITVFAAGETPRLGIDPDYIGKGDIKDWLYEYTVDVTDNMTPAERITYMMYLFIEARDNNEKLEIIRDLVVYCYYKVTWLGYYPDCCMSEVMKEINSRTGAFDEKQGKWMKFKTPEAMAKWYSADFSRCKLG
jgi:hypothetical protein